MAVPYVEVSLIDNGLIANGPTQDSYVQNMYYRYGKWHVRNGFGQLDQWDTSLSAPRRVGGDYSLDNWGIREHLGSAPILTDEGKLQVLSVYSAHVYTTGAYSAIVIADDPTQPTEGLIYIVRVLDVDTSTSFDIPLYKRTGARVFNEHSTKESCQSDSHRDYDFQDFFVASTKPQTCYFTAFRGGLFFGNEEMGIWVYQPGLIQKHTNQQIDNGHRRNAASPVAEDANITPVRVSDGLYNDAYVYVSEANFPAPKITYASESLGRMLYVSDRAIYISDVGMPAAVQAQNSLQLLTDSPLTAIRELNGAFYIFTDHKTLLWQPAQGGNLVIPGRITTISDTVGCSGQNVTAISNQSLIWCDSNGMYATKGSLNITKISGDVDNFWTNKVTNVLSSYASQQGWTQLETEQLRSEYAYSTDKAHMVYHAHLDVLLLVQPGQRMALALSQGKWSVWNFQSGVSMHIYDVTNLQKATPRTGATTHIDEPWLTSLDDRLFLHGVDKQTITTTSTTAWKDFVSNSAYLLEYGRGGGLDRNIEDEDSRLLTGFHDFSQTNMDYTRVEIGKPIKLEDNYVYQNSPDQTSNPPGPDGVPYQDYLFPVYIIPELLDISQMPFTGFDIAVTFNNTQWAPVLRTKDAVNYSTVDTEVSIVLPPERIHSIEGWNMGIGSTPSAITGQEAQVYSAGVPTVGGDELRFSFNGEALVIPAGSWTTQPSLGLSPYLKNLIFYIPMRRLRSATDTQDVPCYLDWTFVTNPTMYKAPRTALPFPAEYSVWRQAYAFKQADTQAPYVVAGTEDDGPRRMDNVAQPVDWCYQSQQIAAKGAQKVKLRGVRTLLRSSGKGSDTDNGSQGWGAWVDGHLNYLFGSDRKELQAQLIDYSNANGGPTQVDEYVNKQGIRTRMQDVSGNLVTATYGTAHWGDPNVGSSGDYLTADDEVSEVTVSGNVKGKTVSVTLFGRILNKAGTVTLEESVALLRLVGYRGRKGRSS